MQPKESKTNSHFIISIVKSCVRIIGYIGLILAFDNQILAYSAWFLIIAEALGIAEEIF